MLHAETPAASFFSRLHGFERSRSYDSSGSNVDADVSSTAVSAATSDAEGGASDAGVRRAKSLQSQTHGGRILDARRDVAALSSFAAAGSSLTSPLSLEQHTSPPLAARHALFSHHRTVSSSAKPITISTVSSDTIRVGSPSQLEPPSPTQSSVSSSAFSPASAFLSHFSSNASLRPPSASKPDAPGAKVLGYTLGKVLGRGGFSTVRVATNAAGEELACKIVKRDDLSDRSGSLEKFEEEIRIWQTLPPHPCLLPLLEMDRTDYATFLITPLLPGGNLLDVLRREGGSDKTARKWFPGVVKAVEAMHLGYPGFGGNMLHGDLKLDNFLVDHEGKVMACDFYMAKMIDEVSVPPPQAPRRPRQTVPHPYPSQLALEPVPLPPHFPSASLPYAPPELLSAGPSRPALAQDMWALGVVLHALLTGKLPFVDAFDPRLQMKILRGQWDEPQHLGREWLEVLRGCLDGNPLTRWTIEQVRSSDALVGWKEVKKSRSRSRGRPMRRPSLEYAATDPLTSQPSRGPSRSRTRDGFGPAPGSASRGRDMSRDSSSAQRFGRSSGSGSGSGAGTTPVSGYRHDASQSHRDGSKGQHYHDTGPGRGRSAGGAQSQSESRSRSSGRGRAIFQMERDADMDVAEDFSGSMENLHVQPRGRLPHKYPPQPSPTPAADALHFYRNEQHPSALSVSSTRAGSSSRTRNGGREAVSEGYSGADRDRDRTSSDSSSRTRVDDHPVHHHKNGGHGTSPTAPMHHGHGHGHGLSTHSSLPQMPSHAHRPFGAHLQDERHHVYGSGQASGRSRGDSDGTTTAATATASSSQGSSSRSRSRTPWGGEERYDPGALGRVEEEGSRPSRSAGVRGRGGGEREGDCEEDGERGRRSRSRGRRLEIG